jgi:uncharacterized protein YcnI
MKRMIQTGIVTLAALLFTTGVSAHVTVNPKEAVVGYSVATIRVPNEKDVATTRVRVVVPEGVDVHGVMPVSGWQYTAVREEKKANPVAEGGDGHADNGRITEVVWSGGRVGVGEFMEFPLSVQYAADMEKATWKAYQTYAGGEIVPWDGSDDKHPAPIVTVLKEAKVDTLTKAVQGPVGQSPVAQIQWMSVGALLLSAVALAKSMKK